MWFERRKPVSEEPEAPQHWPTERMIQEGHAAYATTDDLKPLDIDALTGVAVLCEVQEVAPDECIPCWAYAEIQERQKEPEEEPGERETPKLDALVAEDPPWVDEKPYGLRFTDARHGDPVREIQRQAQYMDRLVEEILNGPPIPPKEVSLEDLACLTLAAKNWIRLMDAQGLELSPKQQSLLDETKQIVSRLSQEDM